MRDMVIKKDLLKDFDISQGSESIEIEVDTVDRSSIAIIGVSGRFSKAKDIKEFWNNIKNGVDCIRCLPENRIKDYYKNNPSSEIHYKNNMKAYLDEVDKFDYDYFSITPNEAKLIDPNQRLFLENTIQALEDAGYGGKTLNDANVGVFAGFSNDLSPEYKFHCMENSTESLNKAVTGNLKSVIPSRISYLLNLKGPSILIDTACSSGLVALHMASQSLKNNECDMAIVGSVELDLFEDLNCEIDLGIKSSDGRTKTFDNSSDGTGSGEGVISIILKPLSKAINDRDNIYSVIKGSAINQDGATIGITAPNAIAQAKVIEKAWRNSGINPETISYIEAHGTGTVLGDPIEIKGVQTAFEKYTNKKQFCTIGSVKSNIGHLNAASGLAGLVKMTLSLKNKKIPPTLHFKNPNKKISFIDSPVYVNNRLIDWEPIGRVRRGGVSSFGLSGTNCHVVLEEAPKNYNVNRIDMQKGGIFCLSAIDLESFYALIQEYINHFEDEKNLNFNDICYTANTGRGHYGHRLAIIADSIDDLKNKLMIFLKKDLKDLLEGSGYYKYHKIISTEKSFKEENEIYEYEKKEMTKKTDDIISKMLKNNQDDKYHLIRNLCVLYVSGADVSWKTLYSNDVYFRCSLPHYQFKKSRCWIDVKKIENMQSINRGLIEKLEESSVDVGRYKYSLSEIIEILINLVSENTGIESSGIDVYMNFFEMGFDSILLLQLIYSIQNKFSIEIPISDLYGELNTITSLAQFVIENCKNSTNLKPQNTDDKEIDLKEGKVTNKENVQGMKVISKPVIPFGQIMIKNDSHLDKIKKAKLSKFINEYNLRTEKSKKYASNNRLTLANNRNAAGFRPNLKELVYPIVAKEAHGSKMIDLDGNEYVDLTMGFGVYLFGNNPEFINKEIIKSLNNNKNIGPMSNLAHKAAKLISELTGVERVTFSNTGTEADMMAIRMARAATKRKKIVVFQGSYHGNYDGVLAYANLKTNQLVSMPVAPGITEGSVEDTIVLEYGSLESLEYIKLNFENIAAVLVEPVQSRKPELQPKEFLKSLRKITKENGIVMIFDEIITGFRILPGGAQKWFDIDADIVTYGKVIGGGMPIGIISGKAEFMDCIDGGNWSYGDTSYPKNTGMKTAFAGTFCQHPLAMTAVITVAEYLINHGEELQLRLNKMTSDMAKSINEFFKMRNVPVEVVHFGSLFRFKSNIDLDLFFYKLIHNGIYVWEGRNCFLSTEHSLEDINKIIEAVKEVTDALIEDEFWNSEGKNTEYYPLSYVQENIYISENLKDVGLSFNMPSIRHIKSKFSINKVKDIFNILINRHEALRTSFHMVKGEPVQQIHEKVEFDIEYFNAINKDYKEFEKKFFRTFDLSKAPLIRVGVVEMDTDDYMLMIDMHHIISDGQSTNILLKEFYKLYNEIELSPIKVQFKDYILHQRNMMNDSKYLNSKGFWINQFKDTIPTLDFPLDYSRKDKQTFTSKHVLFRFENDLTKKLQEFSKKNSVTLFVILFSIYNVLLSKYTNKEDIIVGTPVLGRDSELIMNTVGMFVNTLPIRNYPYKNITFEDFVINVAQQIKNSYKHQDYPLGELLKELGLDNIKDKNPLFEIMFIMDNQVNINENFGELEIENIKKIEMGSKVDIQLEALFNGKEIEFTLIYCSDLFYETTIEKFVKKFNKIVKEVLDNPKKTIGEIDTNNAEKNSLINKFNEEMI
ncbi:aminotransferase class III-fold pyridoxal phosphate-dependent enzyme [Clostridium botulinum]|nr:aminotransferase class III-fold pyridoxal phosphate-dependent enzyme [Clostridium botulinum]